MRIDPIPGFDCVAMQRQGSEHVEKIVRVMRPADEEEFWQRRAEELRREQSAQIKKKPPVQG